MLTGACLRGHVNIFVGSRAPWSALDESIPGFAEYPG